VFRSQETTELREHFGSGNTSTTRQTPYPMLRLVALINVRSHVFATAAISFYRKGEIPLASEFVDAIPADSVTPLDKGFFSADLLLSIQNGAHLATGLAIQRQACRHADHERWEIELGFRDIKCAMQDNTLTLRCKTVDLVYQEL